MKKVLLTDNNKFWTTMKPFCLTNGQVNLIEGNKIIQEDSEVANIINDFFGKAVASLNIGIPREYITDESVGKDDPIEKII